MASHHSLILIDSQSENTRAKSMSQSNKTPEYNEELLEYLQLFRGEGFLSPGGADETRRVLDRVDVENRSVLEIGSGLGGCCLIIAVERGAKQVHGLDVEPVVIAKARETVATAGLARKSHQRN